MYQINKNVKPKKLKLSICKPNRDRTSMGTLKHIKGKVLTVNFGKINELTFSLPYEVIIRNKLVPNPNLEKIKEKYFIRATFGKKTEWFIINKIRKSSTDTDELTVQCFSLGYQLWYRKIIDYVSASINCFQAASDGLKGTGWKVGYVNPDLNLDYRQFDVSSKTRLDFIYDVAETFEAIPVFDTESKLVHFYKEDEISKYKGFWLTYGKYINTIEEEIDSDEIKTRLHVRGSDNLRINAVNPTGQSYIDDFSYFMYPFEVDDEGNVLKSSDFMPDELCLALHNYNIYVSSRKDEFKNKLLKKKEKQELLTSESNYLRDLRDSLQLALDEIQVLEDIGESSALNRARSNGINNQIERQLLVVNGIKDSLFLIDKEIEAFKKSLNIKNFLTEDQLDELSNYIHEEEWTDENKIDENDLYESGIKRLSEINSPPVNITTGIVNFFNIITEQHNWERLSIGDIIKIKHDKLNIMVKTKVTQLVFDFDSDDIKITISNSKKIKNAQNKIVNAVYTIGKVNTDYNHRKFAWNNIANNFNLRNDRISEIPNNPKFNVNNPIRHTTNDNGSVNLTIRWGYLDYNSTNNNKDNIDGFLIYLYPSNTNDKYIFGSKMASETVVSIDAGARSYTFPSVPSNLYYSIAIQAYRRVDDDIAKEGRLTSEIVPYYQPYLPSTSVNFNGSINGINQITSDYPPPNPKINDRWTNSSGDKNVDYSWNGSKWIKMTPTEANDIGAVDSKSYTLKVNEIDGSIQNVNESIQNVDNSVSNIGSSVTSLQQAIQSNSNDISSLNSKLNTNTYTSLTLLNNWVHRSGLNYTFPEYSKDALGYVRLRGLIQGGTNQGLVANLPSGFRPLKNHTFTTRTGGLSGKCAEIIIFSNGDIKVEYFDSWLSLDGIQFYVGNN